MTTPHPTTHATPDRSTSAAIGVEDRVGLADRMRAYEAERRRVAPARTYTLVRMDGKNFRAYTKGLNKPFDTTFAHDMMSAAQTVCEYMTGVAGAYVASDELTVLLTDFATPTTEPWLGGVEAKQISIAASAMTAAFNAARSASTPSARPALFDARVLPLDDPVEVANHFIWRQRDTVRNAVSMAAQAHFGPAAMHRRNRVELREMLSGVGINFDDYPAWARRGSLVLRDTVTEPVSYTDRNGAQCTTTATRRPWVVRDAGDFTVETLLATLIPAHPDQAVQPDRAEAAPLPFGSCRCTNVERTVEGTLQAHYDAKHRQVAS